MKPLYKLNETVSNILKPVSEKKLKQPGQHSATVNVAYDGIININTEVPINNKSHVYINGYPVYFTK